MYRVIQCIFVVSKVCYFTTVADAVKKYIRGLIDSPSFVRTLQALFIGRGRHQFSNQVVATSVTTYQNRLQRLHVRSFLSLVLNHVAKGAHRHDF